MKGFLLDTNTVSYLVRGHPIVLRQATEHPNASICVSAITEGELEFGLARRPAATRLRRSKKTFLKSVDILPEDSVAAKEYAALRASLEGVGRSIGALDLLIAAHAAAVGRILITSGKALLALPNVSVEDWTRTI